MKSLFKIIRRYVLTAVLIAFLVLFFNWLFLLLWGYWTMKGERNIALRWRIEEIAEELSEENSSFRMTKEGYQRLEESPFVWAMLIKDDGTLGWSYQLPPEIPHNYTLADISVLSKWYLKDYPVFTWTCGDGVLVMGMEKESVARFNMEYSVRVIEKMPALFFSMVFLNLCLTLLLALVFGYRFYCSLRPIAQGIERISNKEAVFLPEKGMTDELSRKLNQTSRILVQQNNQLAKRDNARTNWISGVSHDIRTPLSLILGYADSLSRNPVLDQKGQKEAQSIRRQALSIKKLIEDLNLTSKLEYNAQPLRIEKFLPAVLLRQVAADFYNEEMLGDSILELDVQENAEQIQMEGDTQMLERAFRNLIGNSVRYAPGLRILVSMSQRERWLRFLFQDFGPGIPSEVVDIVEGITENPNIHVMGLRVVRQIVQAHRGRMEFLTDGVCLWLPQSLDKEENGYV